MKGQVIFSIGERIKTARRLVGLSRRAFEQELGIPAATLQAWEDDKYEISTKGLIRLIEALHKVGLATSQDWLIRGIGTPPQFISTNEKAIFPTPVFEKEKNLSEDEIILREVSYFELINNSPLVIMISDDTMEPIFGVGDYVGGNSVSGKFAFRYVGSFCIIQLTNGETYVKKLKYGSRENMFNLVSINLETRSNHAFLLNCKIATLAQIVWHRKNEIINT
ncbi:MAG: helix-turn-helix transcriptional regulator [Tatlockia sp.]|nr:helix-turn-helix transcriptional regulator [Tatlockia sp.]